MSNKISVPLGDGLTFDGNQISIDCGDNVSIITTGTDGEQGLYVNNLKGPQGPAGGSTYDNWTCVPGKGYNMSNFSQTIPNFVDGNREVIDLIFSTCLYKANRYQGNGIDWTSTIKTVGDIIDSINYPISYECVGYSSSVNRTSYHPNAGELFQLVTNPTTRKVYSWGSGSPNIWVEAHSRQTGVQEVVAMFVIRDIAYQDKGPGVESYWINSMRLSCLYVNSGYPDAMAAFSVGNDYTGTTSYSN